ncbi:MAG: hypothetical protein QOD39_2410 [Mycobacterium sp.]|nr:hypothetical protein [Mycobacterium sp.]
MHVLSKSRRSATVSPGALEIHVRAGRASVRTDCPAFVSDACLDTIAPGQVTTMAALELCMAGLWDRARGGYVIADFDLIDRLSVAPPWRWIRSACHRLWVALNSESVIPL